jgi:hypothetical protein
LSVKVMEPVGVPLEEVTVGRPIHSATSGASAVAKEPAFVVRMRAAIA